MLAIDTNVVVRYLTDDQPRQSARAKALVDNEQIFVATTVLLETEWVLRSVYGFKPAEVLQAVSAFLGLPHVTLENPALVAKGLNWAETGLDFGDALHLAAAGDCDGFVSFDKKFVKSAKAIVVNVRLG